jgi:hypothetical protein
LIINNYKHIDEAVIGDASKNLGGEDYIAAYNDPFEFSNMKIYSAKL